MSAKSPASLKNTASKKSDVKDYPFLVKTLITFTKSNNQGHEEKCKDEVVFKLDRASARLPWYVLRNYSVPKFLTAKYGPYEVAWQRIYEIKIVKLINRAKPEDISDIPLRVMTMNQLENYVEEWELGVPVTEFYSVEKAREMVALRQQDEKGYDKHLAEYREGKQRSYPELDNMRGDQEAATSDIDEFDALEKEVPEKPTPKKPEPAAVADSDDAAALDDAPVGEVPGAEAASSGTPGAGNPFAGV